ncbi:MAG TPA: type 1 glutamine amidotransferase [Polyangiaceae bacterium]|nr:type 1 glutamine amidotransferase [Polyangiaceae bacterium]
MPRAHVLTHLETEGPSRIADAARRFGLEVELHPLFSGAAVPEEIPDGDVLVVMGGSMGVGDVGDPRYPFLAPEVELLERHVARGRPVLGVCLGAQLLAHALGGRVSPLFVGDPPVRYREVGWGAVTFTATDAEEPVLQGLPPSMVVLHWHGDTFEIPPGGTRLASTLACENQMFRVGSRAYGLQFHVEITGEDAAVWVREDADFVRLANGPAGGRRILEDTERWVARHTREGDKLLDNLFRAMLARA